MVHVLLILLSAEPIGPPSPGGPADRTWYDGSAVTWYDATAAQWYAGSDGLGQTWYDGTQSIWLDGSPRTFIA
ncbi:MAG: hypothetical protein E6Q97_11060 [Desulfurellales bacterium]|nr:MAG: hypothetical protein E6Q97_11060 [Desulfurellales bacterium]